MADLFHFNYHCVGHHYGKHKIMKALGTGFRAMQLLPTALHEKPDLAVSHGSRSQLIAAKATGIPSLVIFDYEFARPIPGLHPAWVMFPEVIPESVVPFHGCGMLKYPGLKEDVYVPSFEPDSTIRSKLGVEESSVIVTVRPPANEAHYHNPESEKLYHAAIEVLCQTDDTTIVLLPRNEKQAHSLRERYPACFAQRKIIIPDHAVDGLNLIWHSDLVISGGGTMNREAAVLDVPVYSVFRGTIGAVDKHLAATGRLVLLETVEDVRTKLIVKRRDRKPLDQMGNKETLSTIVNQIAAIAEAGGKRNGNNK